MTDELGFVNPDDAPITNFQPCRYTEVDVNTGARAEFFRLETIKVATARKPFWSLNKGTICCRWVTDPPNFMLLSPMVATVGGVEAPLGIQGHPDDLSITQVSFEEYVQFLYEFAHSPQNFFLTADTYDELEEKIVTGWLGGVVVESETD